MTAFEKHGLKCLIGPFLVPILTPIAICKTSPENLSYGLFCIGDIRFGYVMEAVSTFCDGGLGGEVAWMALFFKWLTSDIEPADF